MTRVYQLTCSEAGFDDCAFMIRNENRDQIIEMVQDHAIQTHDKEMSQSDVRGLLEEVQWQAADD